MILTLLNCAEKTSKARWEAELKGIYPGVPMSPGLWDAATLYQCRRMVVKKIVNGVSGSE